MIPTKPSSCRGRGASLISMKASPKKRGITLAYDEEPPKRTTIAAPTEGPTVAFDVAASLPAADDNVAIAINPMAKGTVLDRGPDAAAVRLQNGVLEGHRFALFPLKAGELITSWGQPFGLALLPIATGEWIRNIKTLKELQRRQDPEALACQHPNFEDYIKPCAISKEAFAAGGPVPLSSPDESFDGFLRPAGRGVGTRNYGAVMCVSSRTNAFARALERRLRASTHHAARGSYDGVVAMPHS